MKFKTSASSRDLSKLPSKENGDLDKKQYDSAAGSSKQSSEEDKDYEKTAEFLKKAEKMRYSRMWNARLWVIIVMTYYAVRATFIIFPWWEYNT